MKNNQKISLPEKLRYCYDFNHDCGACPASNSCSGQYELLYTAAKEMEKLTNTLKSMGAIENV